ncbi:hypothetical protein MJD09_18915 [bacterium]|nr:hypothetical protein [bacterium]
MRVRSTVRDISLILGVGLLVRLLLLLIYSVPYGNDGIGRVYFKETFFFAHWLPLTQILVYLSAKISDSIAPIRMLFAFLGALAPCGFYLFLKDMVSRRVAIFGGLLFSLNSLYMVLSLMPYQDILFLGLFYVAMALLFKKALRSPIGVFLYGITCLTRYESWFVFPFLVWWRVKLDARNRQAPAGVFKFIKTGMIFGWAPILWVALSWWQFGDWSGVYRHTVDQNFYGWNPHFDLEGIAAYARRTAYWLWRFGSPIVLMAVFGLIAIIRSWDAVWLKIKLQLAFAGLVTVYFFFIDKEFETVNRFVMIPLSVVLVLTIIGIDQIKNWLASKLKWQWILQPKIFYTFSGLIVGCLVVYAAVTVKRLNDRPEFRAPFEITNYLHSVLAGEEKAIVVAERFPDLTDAAPMAYQRIIAQSRLGRERILCAGLLALESGSELIRFAQEQRIRYIVLFEDFEPWLPADTFFADVATSGTSAFKTVFKTSQATIFEVISWAL